MKIRKADGPFGMEFYDLDVNRISDDELEQARATQNEHGVIFFRNQHLSCEQHISFARRWGEIVVNRFFEQVEGYEQIAKVRKEPEHKTAVGEEWHTDHSYDQIPAKGSILYAREVPNHGGDTLFANMYLAYDSLSDELKNTLSSLHAIHSSRKAFSESSIRATDSGEDRYRNLDLATQVSVHPVVIVHPESGKKALYVNPDFTIKFEDWSEEESAPLLSYLYKIATRPENVIRFKWLKGTIAFWDNRATWHKAQNDYPGERRLMHRITLKGVPL